MTDKYITVQFGCDKNLDKEVKEKVEQGYKLIGVTMATGEHVIDGIYYNQSWVATLELKKEWNERKEND